MSDPRDARSRLVDPFDAPEDYSDPARRRGMAILLVGLGLFVLVWVLVLVLL